MTNRNIINIFFHFMLFFVIFIIVLEMVFALILRNKKKQITGKKVNLFGLLMELDNLTIFAIAIQVIRYLFIIYSIFTKDQIIIVHLAILVLLSLFFGITSKSIKNIILETGSSFAMYFGLICSKLLTSYIIEVRYLWYVSVGNILLIIFMIIYATFFLLRNINFVVSKTKYIRRVRNEDN